MSDDLKVIDGGVGAPNAVLKTLDLTGFKSFVHKTHLEFAPGITAIIGPNGSGKTNIVDGIRWALGENNARILRAKRNEELIFGGSESRKALGMAEAIMQLDNSSRRLPIPFEEVEVGRRLYRNGEAEYLVNRSRVRLRDLQDLLAGANLADNAFVVVGQGLTDQILALRPADRRTVIEEASGTRRLQLRPEEALQRVKLSEAELVRVNDILREIGPRVEALRDQASKWNEYETIRNELRRRALRWYKASFGTTADQRADLATKIAGVDKEVDRLTDYVAEGESTTAGTDEDLRAARQEEELRRIGSAGAAPGEAAARGRGAGLAASLAAIRAEHERTRAAPAALPAGAADLGRAREKVAEAARAAEGAAERAGAARNDLQRIDGDLALVRGQTAALREAVDRADAELAAREDAHDLPALPKGFAWLHERIASPDVVRTALGRAVAIAGGASPDAPAPKGCRRVADGIAIFIAPDDPTALAAAGAPPPVAAAAPGGLLLPPSPPASLQT